MTDIISELYYGNIHPSKRDYERTPEMAELATLLKRHEDWLGEHLDGKAKETLSKLADCYAELATISAYEDFREGFTLGARLVMEICYGGREDSE